MLPASLAPDLRAQAPVFARRFAAIVGALVATIARVFLRDPRLTPLIVPLFRRLNRAIRRCNALMALLAAGRLPRLRNREPKPADAEPDSPTPDPRQRPVPGAPRIPQGATWLYVALRHDAAAYASQLAHLLAEPAVAELLATTPAAARILRPILRLLGIPDPPHSGAATEATAVVARENPQSAPAPSPKPPPKPRPRRPRALTRPDSLCGYFTSIFGRPKKPA